MDTVNHTAVDIAPSRHLSVLKVIINVFTTTKIITTTISITQGTRRGPALRAAPGSREPGCREPGAKALGSGGSRRGARAEETAAECT